MSRVFLSNENSNYIKDNIISDNNNSDLNELYEINETSISYKLSNLLFRILSASENPLNNSNNNNNTTAINDDNKMIKANEEEFSVISIIHIIIIGIAIVHLLYFILMIIKLNCFKSEEEKSKDLRKISESCAICLEEIKDDVQLLCSHSYCAKCIVDYAKTRFSFINVECPYCRTPSKLMMINFERTEENKAYFDEIINYNHQLTATMKTSLCLCVDTFRFFFYFSKQILDFNNPRYANERACLICMGVLAFIVILFPILGQISNILDILEDILVYGVLICTFAECFYRRERNRTNSFFNNMENNRNINLDISANVSNENGNVSIENEGNAEPHNSVNNEIENNINIGNNDI